MWANLSELDEALRGEHGEEEQREAERFAEEAGLLEDDPEGDGGEGDAEDYKAALGEELGRLEHAVGRRLTQAEEEHALNSISTEDFGEAVPNLVEQFAEPFSQARGSEDGRRHLGAEAAREAMEAQQAEQNPVYEPPPEPDDDDYEEGEE